MKKRVFSSEYKEKLRIDFQQNNINCFWKRMFSLKAKYLRRLRKTEYYIKTNNVLMSKLSKLFLERLFIKTGWTIGPNVFGKGLIIAHYGTIVVNGSCKFGDYCVLQAGVNISANCSGGNYIYFGTGSKIMKNTTLGSNLIVGANAVVTKSFNENSIVLAGVPAKIISRRSYFSGEEV